MSRLALTAAAALAGGAASCVGSEPPTYAELAASVRARPILARPPAGGVDVFGPAPAGVALTASSVLHLVRVAGTDATIAVGDEPVGALDVLLSGTLSERLFGDPALIRTRSGLRYPPLDERFPGAGDEGHRGLCLAAMAEMGVSLDHPVELEGEAFTLRDVLRDTLAEYHEEQAELEWTAAALARWLPPHDVWRNRFGMTCSLSSLVEELLERPLWAASCAGTHRLIALSTLLGADGLHPFLGGELRARLVARLNEAVECALRTQDQDGSWSHAWMAPLLAEGERDRLDHAPAPLERLLVTGHLAEWLATYGARSEVRAALERSAGWLARELRAMDRETAWSAVCPVAHAVVAARELGAAPRQVAPFPPGDGVGFDTPRPLDASHSHRYVGGDQ